MQCTYRERERHVIQETKKGERQEMRKREGQETDRERRKKSETKDKRIEDGGRKGKTRCKIEL